MLDSYFPPMSLAPTEFFIDEPIGELYMDDGKRVIEVSSRKSALESSEDHAWRRNPLSVPKRSSTVDEANAAYRKRRTWDDGAPMMDDLKEMVPWCSNAEATQQTGATIATI
jgi:hypothetical protein